MIHGFKSHARRHSTIANNSNAFTVFALVFGSNGHTKPQSRIDCLIGTGTTIEGDITFTGGLRVDGHVRGSVIAADGKAGTLVLSEQAQIEGETRGRWYLRQTLGSCNIEGGKVFHILSGNLSHQIEHHLFPDLPSNRYQEIAPRVRAMFEKYDLSYCTRPMPQQVYSAWHKVVRLSLPNGWLATTNRSNRGSPTGGVGSELRSDELT